MTAGNDFDIEPQPELFSALLTPLAAVQTGASGHEIWFHVSPINVARSQEARQYWWDPLFFRSDAPWPESMNHV